MIREILRAEIIILKARRKAIKDYTLNKDFQLECVCIDKQLYSIAQEIMRRDDEAWDIKANR
jgi:hypothetical protein